MKARDERCGVDKAGHKCRHYESQHVDGKCTKCTRAVIVYHQFEKKRVAA